MDVKEVMQLLETKLNNAVFSLDAGDKVIVEIPRSVEEYKLSHPNGALLIVYRGSQYRDIDMAQFTAQERDMEIGVIIAVRTRKQGMQPFEYVDYVLDTLAGIEIFNKTKVGRIAAAEDEFLNEENGVWYYAVTFAVPTEFWQSVSNAL